MALLRNILPFLGLTMMMMMVATNGFVAPSGKVGSSSSLNVVKFDKTENQWVTTDPATEGPEAGYDVWGTLLRGGPKPVFSRIFTPNDYEQAILKFMAGDKVDRLTAQANMDNFLENAQDWAYYRMQGKRPDYLTVSYDQVVLRIVWSSIVFAFLGRAIFSYTAGESFWAFFPH